MNRNEIINQVNALLPADKQLPLIEKAPDMPLSSTVVRQQRTIRLRSTAKINVSGENIILPPWGGSDIVDSDLVLDRIPDHIPHIQIPSNQHGLTEFVSAPDPKTLENKTNSFAIDPAFAEEVKNGLPQRIWGLVKETKDLFRKAADDLPKLTDGELKAVIGTGYVVDNHRKEKGICLSLGIAKNNPQESSRLVAMMSIKDNGNQNQITCTFTDMLTNSNKPHILNSDESDPLLPFIIKNLQAALQSTEAKSLIAKLRGEWFAEKKTNQHYFVCFVCNKGTANPVDEYACLTQFPWTVDWTTLQDSPTKGYQTLVKCCSRECARSMFISRNAIKLALNNRKINMESLLELPKIPNVTNAIIDFGKVNQSLVVTLAPNSPIETTWNSIRLKIFG